MKDTDKIRGSITTEAAIVLPLFLCVIISITFFIKVVYTHEIIQHAICGTADEMAATGYIYSISGLQDIHDSVRDGLGDKSRLFKDHMSTFFDAYDDIGSIVGNREELAGAVEDIAENPVQELESIACSIAAEGFNEVKTQLCIPVVKLYMNKYLRTDSQKDIDKRLKSLNVVGGLSGMDFSGSSFFEDENNDIDIVVKYKISLPVPFEILPDMTMVQRASSRAWLGASKRRNDSGQGTDEYDIWSLSNLERGSKLRELLGANLPFRFPVIARFDSGTAAMIKSMDLTADSYQNKSGVEEKVMEYILKLQNFKGQEEPWGAKGIVIKGNEICNKKLILVIPGNPVDPEIYSALDRCRRIAESRGITLVIEKYGYKKLDDDSREEN